MPEGVIRQPVEDMGRVLPVEANVVHRFARQDRGDLCHAVYEWLYTDIADLGVFTGAMQQVFAAAETDFKMDAGNRRQKQRAAVRRSRDRKVEAQ